LKVGEAIGFRVCRRLQTHGVESIRVVPCPTKQAENCPKPGDRAADPGAAAPPRGTTYLQMMRIPAQMEQIAPSGARFDGTSPELLLTGLISCCYGREVETVLQQEK
jgi:hypothetical protein